MPSAEEYRPLLRLGPFKGVDYTSADPLLDSGRAISAQNANPTRRPGALMCEAGRTLMHDFSSALDSITALYSCVGKDNTHYALVQGLKSSAVKTILYDKSAGTSVVLTGANAFTQAVQYGAVVYTNAGQRFFLNPAQTQAYEWQYPAPAAAGNITLSSFGSGSMAAATYFYVVTRQTIMPDGSVSETSVDLNQFANPPSFTLGSTGGITVTPTGGFVFTGTNADGTTFTTNLYRQSTLQAGYLLVTNLTTNSAYNDTASDQSLLQNAALEVSRDPPPCSATNLGWLAINKSRIWVWVIVNNANTNDVSEPQLWYSNLGRTWEFDQISQVLLLQSDVISGSTGNTSYFDDYANQPAGLGKAGTILLAFTHRQTWGVYGDAPSDFLQRELFNIGCIAPYSITSVIGGVYWLSENGVYFFDGSSPSYNAAKITNYLRPIPGYAGLPSSPGISVATQIMACGSFRNLTYYLHFPTLQQSIGYNSVTGEWTGVLPYAPVTPSAICTVPANPASTTGFEWDEVLAARTAAGGVTSAVDWYFSDPSLDLGLPQACTWTGACSSAPETSFEKQYRFLTTTGPIQKGAAVVTLVVDPGSGDPLKTVEWTIPDLSTTPRQIKSLGYEGGTLRGFMAQLTVELQGVEGQPAPQLWDVSVWGIVPPDRNLVPRT